MLLGKYQWTKVPEGMSLGMALHGLDVSRLVPQVFLTFSFLIMLFR